MSATLAAWVTAVVALAPAAAPTPSFHELPLSNGFGAAVVEDGSGKLTTFLTHPYAERSAGDLTPDILYDSYAGVAVDSQPGVWLGEVPAAAVRYVPGTGLVEVTHQVGPVTVRTTLFEPWDLLRPAVVLVAEATNTDPVATHAVTVAALCNFHLGPGAPEASESDERIERVGPSSWLEGGTTTEHRVAYRAWPAADMASASPDNPYPAFKASGVLAAPAAIGAPVDQSDAVVGFARGPVSLPPGGGLSFAVVAAYGTAAEGAGLHPEIDTWLADRAPLQLVADEVAAWEAWHGADTLEAQLGAGGASGLSDDARAVWRQGLALVRMSQVREPNGGGASPHGQVLASLPPGIWNRAWPRDGAYATAALARVGYLAEAWDALSFVLHGDAGSWQAEVGAPYLVSVARYFGDGSEESDLNEYGPNIEFDDFGLFLWALGEWVDAGGDLALVEPHWDAVRGLVADVLVGLIEPATGLLAADSSIWEVHWDGQQKHFTYSSVAAVAGLCATARLAQAFGDDEAAAAYAEAASSLRDAVVTQLVDPVSGGLAGNLEELASGTAVDAAAVEAINWGLVAPDSALASATLGLLETLRIAPDRGYARNDDGGWYDQQEWVFIDLRVAAAYALAGQPATAAALVDWVVAQTRANHDLIAELYAVDGAGYEGAVPMAGYGGGAFGLAHLPPRPVMGPQGCLELADGPAPSVDEAGDIAGADTAADDAISPEPVPDAAVGLPELPAAELPAADVATSGETDGVGPSPDAPGAGEVSPGADATAPAGSLGDGETSGGETSGGETSSGETSAGGISAGAEAASGQDPPGRSGCAASRGRQPPAGGWLLLLAWLVALTCAAVDRRSPLRGGGGGGGGGGRAPHGRRRRPRT